MSKPGEMPTRSRNEPNLLVDTSVAVALSVVGHEAMDVAERAVAGGRLGLSGHAAFETFSVLTRLPPPARRTPATVQRLISASFPFTRFLSAAGTRDLFARLHELGIAGGAIFDALVGAAAVEHETTLITRDGRALRTYQALEVEVLFID
jgi:predicted nucleic acid-binding protein